MSIPRLNIFLILVFTGIIPFAAAQNANDSIAGPPSNFNADDPSQFLSRIEVYNELQYRRELDFYLNFTVMRGVVKIGKRFTSRIDVPVVNNSFSTGEHIKHAGLGDISFRLLGYKIFQKPKSALTTSIEVLVNTAQSPLLGFGKNLLIPMVTYSKVFPKQKMLLAVALQQTNSVSGDETRPRLNFTKVQLFIIKRWSPKFWAVLQPEWYFDYIGQGVSMNLRSRLTHAPVPRLNVWLTPSVGVFGDFGARYQWSMDAGFRYYLFRG